MRPRPFLLRGGGRHSIELNSEADLAGLQVGVVSGSSYDMELSSRDDISLQRFNSEGDILQALINEKVDVSVTDEVVFNAETRKEYDVKVALLGKDNYPTAFMFQKNNPGLAQAMTATSRGWCLRK